MKVKVWVTNGYSNCGKDGELDIADAEWEGMSDDEKEAACQEFMFDKLNIEWGFFEVAE